MATHLAAYFQSQDSATLVNVNVVVDDILSRPAADRFQVPIDYNSIFAVAALGTNLTRAQIQSPSLAVRRENFEVFPRAATAAAFSLARQQVMIPPKEILLKGTENLTFQAAENGAGATSMYGLVWLKKPGPLPPMPDGEIRIVRATGTTTLTVNAWTTVTLTLDNDLEPGLYVLVGFLPISANSIAARAIVLGQNYRPGMPALSGTEAAATDFTREIWDKMMFYDMGHFAHTSLPQFQFLSSVGDTAETVFLYLIRIGEAPGTTP